MHLVSLGEVELFLTEVVWKRARDQVIEFCFHCWISGIVSLRRLDFFSWNNSLMKQLGRTEGSGVQN